MTAKILKINSEDFFKVLKEWEKYTFVLLKKLAKDMPTSFELDSYERQYIYAPFAKEVKLSDLSELLWKSLESGIDDIDTVHDEHFVDEQVDYFKKHFSSAEIIVGNFDYLAENFHHYDLNEPMKFFVKLGKLAQLQLIQEGFLEMAVSNYEKAKQILEKRYYDGEIQRQEQLEKNRIILRVKKRVREQDNDQCVFCGRSYNYHSFDYLKTNQEEFEADSVLLGCKGCLSKRKKQNLEPKFGRFLSMNKEV